MFSKKRFLGYLATGVMPERTALDESLAEHDRKYHGGHYDPQTQTCEKREKLSASDKNDLSLNDKGNRFESACDKINSLLSSEYSDDGLEGWFSDAKYDGEYNLVEAVYKPSAREGRVLSSGYRGYDYDELIMERIESVLKPIFTDNGIKPLILPIYDKDKGIYEIEVQEAEQQADGNSNYKLTDSDRDYLKAIEDGDKEKAWNILLDFASKAMPGNKVSEKKGKTSVPAVVWHGTESGGFNRFDLKKQHGSKDDSIWFSYDRDVAATYAETSSSEVETVEDLNRSKVSISYDPQPGVYKCFIYLKSPKVVDYRGYGALNSPRKEAPSWYARNLTEKQDGVICKNIRDEAGFQGSVNSADEWYAQNTTVGITNPKLVKSANLVTYDDDGNIIPPSRRFDFTTDDIRY